jgi:GT2 family glycosyltransferase
VGACLEALRAAGGPVEEVLLVDSGSPDGTAAHVRARFPEVHVDACPHNVGYAAGHNRSFARARGRHFLALNPDVVLAPGALGRLVAGLEADPRRGAVTGRLRQAEHPERIDSAGIARTATRFVDRGRGAPVARFDREEEVFGACGAAALYRMEALRAVARPGEAPFAERFFMYYEDVDLAWRLRRAGWTTRYVPSAECLHVRGGSGADAPFVEYHLVRNRLWLSARNARGAELLLDLPGLVAFQAVKTLQCAWRPHLRAALVDAWRGLGPALAARREA